MPHINKFSSETLSSVEPSEERNKEANKKKNNVSFIFEKVSGFESLQSTVQSQKEPLVSVDFTKLKNRWSEGDKREEAKKIQDNS